MATVAFTAFLPEVLPVVQGAATPVVLNAIRNACIEFCAQSGLWQVDLSPVDLATYTPLTFVPPTDTKVVQVMTAAVDGVPITPKTVDELSRKLAWDTLTAERVEHYYQRTSDTCELYPIPSSGGALTMRVAVAPKRTALVFDESIYEDWLEELASGALARLLTMPGAAWTNDVLGMFHRDKFQKAISAAEATANKSFSRAETHVVMRPAA